MYNKRTMKYEYIKNFEVKYCETDFKDELKLSTVLSYMEEVACLSADELGFGYEYIKSKGHAFVVSNIHCEFVSPIKLGERVRVSTWPTPPSYVIFGREYRFWAENTIRINASSRWCLLDVETGKILQSKVIDNQDYSTYNTDKVMENVQWKIPTFQIDQAELRYSFKVASADYDHNMHVNNTHYADYCINCFSVAELAEKTLKSFSITYVKQCYEGETLRFYRKNEKETYFVQGVNEKDEIVMQAKLVFAENGVGA